VIGILRGEVASCGMVIDVIEDGGCNIAERFVN
jgi:hypothetical protein